MNTEWLRAKRQRGESDIWPMNQIYFGCVHNVLIEMIYYNLSRMLMLLKKYLSKDLFRIYWKYHGIALHSDVIINIFWSNELMLNILQHWSSCLFFCTRSCYQNIKIVWYLFSFLLIIFNPSRTVEHFGIHTHMSYINYTHSKLLRVPGYLIHHARVKGLRYYQMRGHKEAKVTIGRWTSHILGALIMFW